MKDRIKEIRKSFGEQGKSQDSFAKFLGISVSNLASYETGRRTPTDAVVQLICQKCNINEDWIRHGKGPMKIPYTDKLSTYMAQISKGNDDFIKDLIEVYMELDPTSKNALKELAKRMADKQKERGQL